MSPTRLTNGQADDQSARQVESVQRALQLLRMFLEVDRRSGVGVTEAADALGISKSSASRMLRTLDDAGFTVMDQVTRRHYVGPTAFAVGSRFDGADLARIIQPILQDLAEQTHSTSQFGILRDNQVMYLAVVQSSARLRVIASPGDMRFAHASSMGKAILAAMPPTELAAILESMTNDGGLLPAVGPHSIRDPALLRRDLDEIAVRGYSMSNEEVTEGVSAVGASIPNAAGIHVALSISFAAQSLPDATRQRWAEQVMSAAAASAKLLTRTLAPS
jgi:IclR family acetate operon transcriptional repressor